MGSEKWKSPDYQADVFYRKGEFSPEADYSFDSHLKTLKKLVDAYGHKAYEVVSRLRYQDSPKFL
jgi:hypothetical protein